MTARSHTHVLPDHIREFLREPNFATVATIDEDGAARQAVIWFTLEDDSLILNSAVGRKWPANLVRDGRVSVAVTDRADGLRWVGILGEAERLGDPARAQADIAGMARRYHADEPEEGERLIRDRFTQQQRISFRVHIRSVYDHLDD